MPAWGWVGVGTSGRIFKDELSYFVGPSAVKLMAVNEIHIFKIYLHIQCK